MTLGLESIETLLASSGWRERGGGFHEQCGKRKGKGLGCIAALGGDREVGSKSGFARGRAPPTPHTLIVTSSIFMRSILWSTSSQKNFTMWL